MLGQSNLTTDLHGLRVVHGYKRPTNIRDILVHSRLRMGTARAAIQGSIDNECLTRTCRYCPKSNNTGDIISPATGKTSKCCKNFNCSSTNLIYCLKCTHCNLLYVGQTKRALKTRMGEHFGDITHSHMHKPMGYHFNKPNGPPHPKLEAVEIYVLKFIKAAPDSLRAINERNHHEMKWIHRLKTMLPFGLNSMVSASEVTEVLTPCATQN